jgi:hypothetical protein
MNDYYKLPDRYTVSDRTRSDEQYTLFLVKVKRVDYEQKTITITDKRTDKDYETKLFPVNSSSTDITDGVMPNKGSLGLGVFLESRGSYTEAAVVCWVLSDAARGMDAIATRPITSNDELEGYTTRTRGIFRKMYPGQRATVLTAGFTEKTDEGWDRTSSDFSREKLDSFRRTHSSTTGREVSYTDSGLSFHGAVNRPNASTDDILPTLLPDGTKDWTLYLSSSKRNKKDRYFSGAQDLLSIVEQTEKIQEFALDFPLPLEVLETDMLDTLMGISNAAWSDRTSILTKNGVSYDDQSFIASQDSDHPDSLGYTAIGPSTKEGGTPRRRGWIIESTKGTLVGSNSFDTTTYGKILKPTIFPYTKQGRFGSDVESGYLPINKKADQSEARLAASAWSMRFPYEYNTTRWEVSKEGHLQFEIGSTIPKENISWDGGTYEHPYGAGRSVDGHLTGSLRLAIGKNRDEEESIDLTTMGGAVLRLGSDDTTLPNSSRIVKTQIRGQKDAIGDRKFQYWTTPKLTQTGDAGSLNPGSKLAAECVSLRAAFDGGTFLRLGARDQAARRRHLKNGYNDGQGTKKSGDNSHAAGRPVYGVGDAPYAYHDLTKTASPVLGIAPYTWSGDPVGNMDTTGLSGDIHAVRDILLRIGQNPQNGQSLLLDLLGGIVAAVGTDNQGRSLVAAFDGGIEATIGNAKGKGLKLEIDGDVDIAIKGNLHLNVTGDIWVEGVRINNIAKLMMTNKSLIKIDKMLVAHNVESPIVNSNQDDGLTSPPMGD